MKSFKVMFLPLLLAFAMIACETPQPDSKKEKQSSNQTEQLTKEVEEKKDVKAEKQDLKSASPYVMLNEDQLDFVLNSGLFDAGKTVLAASAGDESIIYKFKVHKCDEAIPEEETMYPIFKALPHDGTVFGVEEFKTTHSICREQWKSMINALNGIKGKSWDLKQFDGEIANEAYETWRAAQSVPTWDMFEEAGFSAHLSIGYPILNKERNKAYMMYRFQDGQAKIKMGTGYFEKIDGQWQEMDFIGA